MSKVYSGYDITLNKDENRAYKAKILKIEGNSYQETRDEVAGTTVSGDFISISDAQDLPITKFNIEGKSVQETREGYNKLKNTATTQTINGVTFTVNKDGTVIVNGTATANAGMTFEGDWAEYTKGTYRLTGCPSGGSASTYRIIVWKEGYVVNAVDIGNGTKVTFDGTTKYKTQIFIESGVTVNNLIFKPMITEETESKPYEQYGASPSIEYEAPIESVGDNIQLFDISTITANKYIDSNNGNMLNSSVTSSSDYIEVKANKLYTILYDYETLQNTGNRAICLYNKDKTYLSGITYVISSTNKKATITPTQDGYMRFSYDNNFTNIKVVQGTSTGAYSPYGQGSVEIYNCNKNFLDLTKNPYHENSSVLNGAKVTLNGGVLNVDATNSTGAVTIRSIWADYKSSSTILLPKGTYYTALILNITGVESLNSKQVGGGTFTLEEDCYLTQWFFSVAQGNKSTKVLQIEKGETATEYVEHQSQTKTLYTQQPFRAIGDVKDRFVKKMGKWYEEHFVYEKILDENETIGYSAEQGEYTIFQIYVGTLLGTNVKSSKLPAKHNWGSDFNFESIWTGGTTNSSLQIKILTSRLSEFSTTAIKTWLSENNMTVIYALETPNLIECTEEQIEQLDYFYEEAKTYEGVNHIYSIDEVKPTISLRYNYIPALPSLDGESKVESVGNNKQLLNKNTITDGIFILLGNGKEYKNDVWSQSDFIQVKPKGIYSAYNSESINNSGWIEVSEYDEEKKWIKSGQHGSKGNKGTTFTLGRKTFYIRLGYRNDVGLIDLKLSEGEKITTYSPFGQGSLKINHLNRNLVDMNKIAWRTNTNGTYEYISNNEIKVNAKSGTYSGIYTKEIAIQDFRKPVIISFEMKADQNCKVYVGTAGVDRKTIELTPEYKRFVLKDIGKNSTGAIVFYGQNLPTDLSFYIKNLMISYEESEFIPHQSKEILLPIQEPFRKNGNVTDIFVKKNDRWYEQHNIIRHIFDGTEVFQANVEWNTASPEIYHAFFKPTNWKIGQRNAVSNYFDFVIQTERDMNAEQIYCSTTNASPYLFIKTERLADEKTTADNINTYLTELNKQGKTIYLEYEAETPVLIPCTPQQSTILDQLENIQLYDGVNYIYTTDGIQPLFTLELYDMIEDYDLYVSNDGYFGIPGTDIKFLVNFHESNLPTMPEAVEASVRAAGRDGDYVLNTTYEPLPFEIVCYTEDNLTPTQKKEIESKVNRFLNSIKNRTKRIAFEKGEKFYNVKYNGLLTTTNYPAHLKFSIPLKSSESFGKDAYQKVLSGNSTEVSDTVEEVGALITIYGPATLPIIALNDYSMEYDTAILEGARVEIDTAKSTATHINSDGVKTNVMRHYNHQFPKIQPGENTLKVLSGVDDENNVTVKWNDLKL